MRPDYQFYISLNHFASTKIVSDIKAGGPEAIAAAKQLTLRVPQMQVDEAFTWTSELSASLFKGEEAQEGMRAYLDKRPPSWMND